MLKFITVRSECLKIPLFFSLRAGFPSPAEDYLDTSLELNDLVIKHPAATFFVRVQGDSMIDVGLVDCNNFYVECERLFQPELVGKPLAVLSNNDGCIVSRSNEVKAMGIPMGIPVFQARDDFLFNGVEMRSSNYALYGDMSARVVATLRSFTPSVEVYSIDESFLKLPDKEDLERLGHCIRQTVKQWTGLPVSVGTAKTKVLAKLANKVAKKYKDGVFNLVNHPRFEKVLDYIPVSDIWEIGKRYAEKLRLHRNEPVRGAVFRQIHHRAVRDAHGADARDDQVRARHWREFTGRVIVTRARASTSPTSHHGTRSRRACSGTRTPNATRT